MNAEAIDSLIRTHLPAAANGDRDAYGRIVAASQNAITAIALAITRDVPASEDIAQEAFLSAWQHLRRLRNPGSFLPWLRQITRNLARDHLRAKLRGPRPVDDADAAIEAAADPSPSPMQQLIDHERQAVAADMISALPEDSREVLLLFYREGQSSQQVAGLLGLSDAAVRKRLSRARHLVREELLARFGEFARASAPSIGFTTMVATALGLASPLAAAAGLLTSAAGLVGAKTVGKVLLGAAGSVGLAILAALAGVFLGLRQQLKGAIDEPERIGLVRIAAVNALASIGFAILLVLLATFDNGWILPVLATLAFMGIICWQCVVVQPRVLARRHALEARRDPVAAARARRRERLQSWVGAIIGFAFGFGGLVYGLLESGRF